MLTKDYYNDFFEIGQQKMNFSFFELSLPDDDPVYTLKISFSEFPSEPYLDFQNPIQNPSPVSSSFPDNDHVPMAESKAASAHGPFYSGIPALPKLFPWMS